MNIVRIWCLLAMAGGLFAQTSSWDTSGNGSLNGTYYFRHVLYQLSSAGTGQLYDAYTMYGTVTFSGTGTYNMNVTVLDFGGGQRLTICATSTTGCTYSIAASGHGFISNPIATGDLIYGSVNAQGIFIGSSTENSQGYHDLFIAAPLASPAPTASSFKGAYSLAYMDASNDYGNPLYTVDAMVQMAPDGAGNLGTVGVAAYEGQTGSSKVVQSLTGAKYIFSGGAGVVTFPNSSTALLAGQYYLYFSPDGNFVFGGSPTGFDMFVGVRTNPSTGTPDLNGLYYEAGLHQDESTLASGYADLTSYYGSMSAAGDVILGHERVLDVLGSLLYDYTYSDSYTVGANGTYTTPTMNWVVANGIRIGSGIGPYLGLRVGLHAAAMNSNLSTTGVFLDPTGVVNAGSSAPFTAAIAPGELLTLYGQNLAPAMQIAGTVPFPTTLGKVQVSVNGLPAPLYYVTPGQISAVVPYGVSGSVAKIQVFNNNVPSNTVTAWIAKTAPGVLTQSQNGLGYGDVLHLDGKLVNAKNPAQPGETVSVFVTGLGAVSPTIVDGAAGPVSPLSYSTSTITAYIGGTAATVTYAGLVPLLPGLYQINLTVPTGLTAGDNGLDIAGPDSYSAECLIAIAGAASSDAAASAAPAAPRAATRPHRPVTGRASR